MGLDLLEVIKVARLKECSRRTLDFLVCTFHEIGVGSLGIA